jgi:hypothetical protein
VQVIVRKALCCAKIREGGFDEVRVYFLSYVKFVFWLCALEEDNKEKKSWWT